MAKSRKKIFPKKPEALHSGNAHTLGKNSNKMHEANVEAIYSQPSRVDNKPLTELQRAMLKRLRSNIVSHNKETY